MKITGAKVLDDVEPKSMQEVEADLIRKEEEKNNEVVEPTKEEKIHAELTDGDVLTHIKNRYGKEISSIDELFAKREESTELPEDVKSFFEYKKETGRGIEDFVKLNKNHDETSSEALLKEYYKHTEDGLDNDDIDDLVESKFSFDEDLDDESDIKAKKIAQKQELSKAKKYFEEQKEKYRIPLESRGNDSKAQEDLKAYQDKVKETEADTQKKSDFFINKTNELLTDEFKGFEFNIGDDKVTFKPADSETIKQENQSPFNLIKRYLGEDGMMKDAEGYHRSLSIAMNPDKFAKHFYEQGQAAAVDDFSKKSKNINMGVRKATDVGTKGGMKVRAVEPSTRGNRLTIKKRIT